VSISQFIGAFLLFVLLVLLGNKPPGSPPVAETVTVSPDYSACQMPARRVGVIGSKDVLSAGLLRALSEVEYSPAPAVPDLAVGFRPVAAYRFPAHSQPRRVRTKNGRSWVMLN
jgi:hypothetical protein